MKRLNQNNTIATKAMLTKMNTMKNKMNLFAKVVMLVAMMGMLVPNKINAAGPVYANSIWYAAYDSPQKFVGSKNENRTIIYDFSSSICFPNSNKLSFYLSKQGGATSWNIEVYQSANNSNWVYINEYSCSSLSTNARRIDHTVNNDTRYIKFYRDKAGTMRGYIEKVGIHLAPHVYAAQNNATVTRNVSVKDCNESSKEETFYLYSFLCQNACTLRIEKVSDPYNCFTCEGSYSITANSCGYTNGTDGNLKNLNNYPFKVRYTPTAEGNNHTATFKITDGINESAIITVNGSCSVKATSITWKTLPNFETTTPQNQYKVEDYITLTNGCSVNDLTLSSSNQNVIEFVDQNNTKYFKINSGTSGIYEADISASVTCGASNTAYFPVSPVSTHVTVNKVQPQISINPSTSSGYVFSTINNITATSNSDANIKFNVITNYDDNGIIKQTATITNYTERASSNTCDLTINTRDYKSPYSEGETKLVASVEATNTYTANSCALTVTSARVTPVISSFADLDKGYVGTQYNLSGKANWAETSGQPARSAWVNGDGVVINYTSSNHDIAADGTTFTPQKAGVTRITASIAAANNHYASTENKSKDLQIDFNPDATIYTFSQNTKVGESTPEVINLANYFVPSGNYTVAVSGTGFSIDGSNNVTQSANKFSVKFTAPTFDESKETNDYTGTVTITDNGKIYTFKIKATAEKKEVSLEFDDLETIYAFTTLNNITCTTEGITDVTYSPSLPYTFNSTATTTFTATSAMTGTYKSGTAQIQVTPQKVTPVLSWAGSELDGTHKGGDKVYLTGYSWSLQEVATPSVNPLPGISASFASDNDEVATTGKDENGWYVQMVGTGTCNITMNVETDGNYNSATQVPHSVTVSGKSDQTIIWNDDFSNMKVGDSKTLTAKSVKSDIQTEETGLEISYTSSPTGIASVSNGTLTCQKAGYVTVTASQSGDDAYEPAESKSKSFKVDFADDFVMNCSTAIIEAPSSTTLDMSGYFVPSGSYTASVTSGSEFSVTTVSGNNITIQFAPTSVNSGSDTEEKEATVTITDNYQIYTFKVKATAEKKNATLAIANLGTPIVFSTINPTLETRTTDATDVTYTYYSNDGTQLATGASYKLPSTAPIKIVATTPATSTYKAGTSKEYAFTPAKVSPSITWSVTDLGSHSVSEPPLEFTPAVMVKGANDPEVTEWSGIAIEYQSSDESVAKVVNGKIELYKTGTVTITPKIKEGVNNNAASYAGASLIVTCWEQTITWSPATTLKVGGNVTKDATTSGNTAITYASGNTNIISNDGTCLKAGYTTFTATAASSDVYCSQAEAENFKVDFADDFALQFTGNVTVNEKRSQTFNMADYFVPSGNYTATASAPEFAVTGVSDNQITIEFAPTSVSNENSDTETKESTIAITDENGQTYTLKVKATAEKRDAKLTISYTGETFAFSTITLSNSKETDAAVAYAANGVTVQGSSYKLPSIAQVTITATTAANATFKAGNVSVTITPKKVTPKVINWSGNYAGQKVGSQCALGQADWDVDETVGGQPEKTEWDNGEVTIGYASSNIRIAEINGSDLVFRRAGLATITASIPGDKNHTASTVNPTKTVKVDFADAAINCGTAYADETTATYDITDMIVPAGTLTYTTTDNDFRVDFSNSKIVVVYAPTTYKQSSSATITFTDTDGSEYHLNVTAGCVKHTPTVTWVTDKILPILDIATTSTPLTQSALISGCEHCDGLVFSSSNTNVAMVLNEESAQVDKGTYLFTLGNGQTTITIYIPETEARWGGKFSETFTVAGVQATQISWPQDLQNLTTAESTATLELEATAVTLTGNPTGQAITYSIVSNPDNAISISGNVLTINSIGTARIKATAAENTLYYQSEMEKDVRIVEPADETRCVVSFNDVTEASGATYEFKLNGHEDYYEVEKISYKSSVRGDKGQNWIGIEPGASRTIIAQLFNNGSQVRNNYEYSGRGSYSSFTYPNYSTNTENIELEETENVTHIVFSGEFYPNANNNKFTEIKIIPRSYLRLAENVPQTYTFGSSEAPILVGSEPQTTEITVKYSFLNSNIAASIVNNDNDEAYPGNNFSYQVTQPDNTCDYGEMKIVVSFHPTGDQTYHKCRLKLSGMKGEEEVKQYFTIEGYASRNPQTITWNQDLGSWNSMSGVVYFEKATTSADLPVTQFELVTLETTAGAVELTDGNKLTIKKSGHVKVTASHPGNSIYLPTSSTRDFDITTVEPTISLSHNGEEIGKGNTVNAVYGEEAYTIDGKALYNNAVINGYSTGTNEKIQLSAETNGVVSIVNGNQLQFLKSGDATITATITADEIVSTKTFTFNVHVDKAQGNVKWDGEYNDSWICVFDTKQMKALPGNDDNTGAITYDVAQGDASFSGNSITINKCESITARATIAETDKYTKGYATKTFMPKKVTPVVTWNGVDFSTDLSQSSYTLTDAATVKESLNEPEISKWTDGKTVTYSSATPNVATLQSGNTFRPIKVGYATIQAKVAEGINNKESNTAERYLKVDFNPNNYEDFGEVGVYKTNTKQFDLSVIEAAGELSASSSTPDFTCGTVADNKIPITFSPQSHDESNPEKTATITIHDKGNNQDYNLKVKGTSIMTATQLEYNQNNYGGWEFVVQLPNETTKVAYGGSSYDIRWKSFPNSTSVSEQGELERVELSLKNNADSKYVDIVDNYRDFVVKQANESNDDDVEVVLVATYPGIENKIDGTSIEIPIKIKKNQYTLKWESKQFDIQIYQHSLDLAAPTLSPTGGESQIEYSLSPNNVATYDGTTLTLTGESYVSPTLTASVRSDKYAKGTSADLSIIITKTDQYVEWQATEIASGITTQKSTSEGIVLNGVAKHESDLTGSKVRYKIEKQENICGNGDIVELREEETDTTLTTTLYYTGNGSGKVYIRAVADETEAYNQSKLTPNTLKELTIGKVVSTMKEWTVNNMHYGDKVTLNPTINEFTKGTDYGYTLPKVTGELTVDGNTLDAKGVGTNLTISAKKQEDCWVTESADKASNAFDIAKSEQEIEWDKTALGTLQGEAYHFTVLDNSAYQLATQAIDKLHTNAETTCLQLVEGKYVTANMTGNAPGGLKLDYSVEEQDGVCKVGSDAIVSVDAEGKMHITGNGTGTVLVIASVDGGSYYENVSETITVVVDKATPTITVTNTPADVHFGDAACTSLAATAQVGGNDVYTDYYMLGSEGHIILSSSDASVVSVLNNSDLQFNKAGQATITAKIQDADCRMNDASTTFDVTVQTTDQTINYTTIDDVNTGQYANPIVIDLNNHFTAYDTRHSKATGGTVAYQVTITQDEGCNGITFDNDHKITIDGTGSGSVSIKATQDGTDASGNTNYNSTEITQSFNVNKITPAVTLDAITGTIQFGDVIALHATASCTDYADDSSNSGTKIKFKYNGTEITGNTFTVDDADGKFTVQAFMDADCQIKSTASSEAEYDIALTEQEIVWNQNDMGSSYTTLDKNQFTLDAYAIDAVHKTTEIKTGATIEYELVLAPDDNSCGAIATLQNGILTLTGAGSGTVTVKATCQGVDGKYSPVTTAVVKTLTITKVDPQVTMETIANVTCGATGTLAATATYGGNEGFTFESSNTDTATVSGNTFTALHAGKVRFIVKKAATCITNAQTSDYAQAVIDKADQTVTWNNDPSTETLSATDMTNGITLSATATSNVTSQATNTEINYSITAGGNLAKIENGKLVSRGAGTGKVTVKATAGTTVNGYEDYNQADAELTFNVVPDNITFTITKLELTYGDEDKAFTVTNDKNLDASGYTMTITSIDDVNIRKNTTNQTHIDAIHAHDGELTVGLKFSGMANYADVETTAAVTVAKASQTIDWDQTYDETYDIFSTIKFNATTDADGTGQNKVYYTWTQTSTCENTPVFGHGSADNIINYDATDGALINAAGTVTITARHDGNENYLPDSCSSKKTFTINKVTPTITWTTEYTDNQTSGSTISLVATSNFNRSNVQYEIVSMTVKDCASLNGNQLTCIKPGEVTVRAFQEAIPCVIDNAGILQTIKIGQGPHMITWDKSKTYSVNNLAGTIDLSNYCKCSTCSTCLITYSIDGTTGVSLDNTDGHTLIIDEMISETLNVKVTASVAGDNTYEASSNDTTFTITVEPLTITVNGGRTEGDPLDLSAAEPYVTSVTDNVDMAQKLVDNEVLSSNYKNVTYTFASDDTDIAKFNNTDSSTIIAYKRSDALKLTVTATVDKNRKCSKDFWVKIPRGTMVFNREGNWDDMLSDGSNWQRRDIKEPSAEDHNVRIEANCMVPVTTAECWDMEIADNGTLTIAYNGMLNVNGTLSNNDASKLVIAADADGQGTLIFHNSTDTDMPQATVEMWCKGSKTETGADGKYINPNWQYRGIAVSSATLTENAPNLIYQWSETAQVSEATGITEQWTKVTGNQMSAWNGYAVAKYTNADGADYKTSAAGELTNADQEISLAYTAGQTSGEGVQSGFNLITNSYTAPLKISEITFGDEQGEDDVLMGVVLYNTGKYIEWKNSDKQIREGTNAPGQYLLLPKYTAEEVTTTATIPSGESFFVVTYETGKTVKINYDAIANQTSGALKMPERREIYNKLIIEVDGGEGADRLYLLENENRIRGYENGYDGPKYAGTKGNPMLYATTDDGRLSVSADSSLLGQYIGFAAGKHDVTYTISFDASALSGYSELYLYDTREKRYINILDGGTYTFKGLVSGEDKRFKIVGSRSDGESVTGDEQMIIVTGNRFHVSGYDNTDERIYLVDMTGKILWETTTAFGPWFDIPTDMPAGVYIIKLGSHTQKMMVK